MIKGVYPTEYIHNIMDDPVFYLSGHNDDENKDDNNDDTQGSSTVPYPRAIIILKIKLICQFIYIISPRGLLKLTDIEYFSERKTDNRNLINYKLS